MHWIALLAQLEASQRHRRDGGSLPPSTGELGGVAVGGAVPSSQHEPDTAEDADLTDPLTALGWWALQFTPKVSLQQGAVLLEVSASARLWGGRGALLRHIDSSNKPLTSIQYGQGDTSLVAIARAFAPCQPPIPPDDLPLSSLLAAQPHLDTLARLGCTRWGQLRALPRAGVARRFGAALVDALDQAYGSRPDVYPWLTLPEVFDAALELPSQVESAAALLFGARRLLAQLQVWLQLRQLGVLAVELGWQMDARRHTATQGALVLRTAQASADISHLQRLLAERLGQVTLAAPALSLRLRSLETQPLNGASASLLPDDQPQGDSLAHLLERLCARLGAHNVLRLQPQADHRPEQMQVWQAAAPGASVPAAVAGPRQAPKGAAESSAVSALPVRAQGKKSIKTADGLNQPFTGWASALYPTWLLAEPLPLAVHHAQPHYQGPLTLLAGPQRLEAGWWCAGQGASKPPANVATVQRVGQGSADCAGTARPTSSPAALRDYFVARTPGAVLLWIYRERLAGADPVQASTAWYLQGVFA